MAQFKNFSFKNVSVIFGITEIGGFAEGDDVISIEFDEDQFTKMIGANGDGVRVQTTNNSVTITLKLLQTSDSNKDLTSIFNLDRETGANVMPFIVSNKESGETIFVNNAWIQKYPTFTRGAGANSMEWVLQGDFATVVIL